MWSAQADAERLTLLVAENKTGYFGVYLNNPGYPKPKTTRENIQTQRLVHPATELKIS